MKKERFIFTKKTIEKGNSSRVVFVLDDTLLKENFEVSFDGRTSNLKVLASYMRMLRAFKMKSRARFMEIVREYSVAGA